MKKKKQLPKKTDPRAVAVKDFFDMLSPSAIKFFPDYLIGFFLNTAFNT